MQGLVWSRPSLPNDLSRGRLISILDKPLATKSMKPMREGLNYLKQYNALPSQGSR